MTELDDVRRAVLAELKQAPAPPSWRNQTLALIALSALATAVSLAVAVWLGLGEVTPRWPSAVLAATIGVSLVAAVRPGSASIRRAALGLGGVAVLSHLLGAATRAGHAHWLSEPGCAPAEIGIAIVPALATVAVLRHFAYQPVRATLGGIGVGACGLLVLDLTCHVPGVTHAVVFHVLPFALVVGALVGLRRRARTRSFVP